jgi:hypothetical protein
MTDNLYIPMRCDACGAPLPNDLVCKYCGTRHTISERYSGPQIMTTGYGDQVINFNETSTGTACLHVAVLDTSIPLRTYVLRPGTYDAQGRWISD